MINCLCIVIIFISKGFCRSKGSCCRSQKWGGHGCVAFLSRLYPVLHDIVHVCTAKLIAKCTCTTRVCVHYTHTHMHAVYAGWKMHIGHPLHNYNSHSILTQPQHMHTYNTLYSHNHNTCTHTTHIQHTYTHVLFFRLIPLEELSVGQMEILRKLSLIKLTSLVELYNGKANM